MYNSLYKNKLLSASDLLANSAWKCPTHSICTLLLKHDNSKRENIYFSKKNDKLGPVIFSDIKQENIHYPHIKKMKQIAFCSKYNSIKILFVTKLPLLTSFNIFYQFLLFCLSLHFFLGRAICIKKGRCHHHHVDKLRNYSELFSRLVCKRTLSHCFCCLDSKFIKLKSSKVCKINKNKCCRSAMGTFL